MIKFSLRSHTGLPSWWGAVNILIYYFQLRNTVIMVLNIRVCMGMLRSFVTVRNMEKKFNKNDLHRLLCGNCVSVRFWDRSDRCVTQAKVTLTCYGFNGAWATCGSILAACKLEREQNNRRPPPPLSSILLFSPIFMSNNSSRIGNA